MEEKAVFEYLRACLFTDGAVDHADPDAVFAEMKAHSVAALPADWLRRHPGAGTGEWSAYCAMQQAQWIRVMHGQSLLLELMEAEGIPCVILKGAAAAMYYPQPSLRTMGDVDVLVKRADHERAAALMEENGYLLTHEKDPGKHHTVYEKDGIHFELHKRPGIIREEDEERIRLFEQGIDAREIRETEGFAFPVLPAELNGLVLAFHIDQHLRSGIGLRQIVDWMMYMDKLPEDVWQGKVRPLLRDTGTERLALTVTAMCREYLGLRTIVADAEEYPYAELMDYVMEKGNFGKKAGNRGKAASFSLGATDAASFFRRLQDGGIARWKAAKEHAFLRPFAWIYQGLRITGELIRDGIGPGQLLEQRKKGVEQRKLLEALGLSVEREIIVKK